MSNKETVVLTCDAFWAKVWETDELTGKYQVDCSNLDKETVALLQGKGINVAENPKKEDQGFVVAARSKYKPRIVDADGSEFPEGKLIGNGSKVKVKGAVREWTYGPKKGVSFDLLAIKVMELVEYGGNDSKDEFDSPFGNDEWDTEDL